MVISHPRFVTTFKVAGPKSYRLAAAKFMGEYGGNAQNPAECVLRLLTARAGCRFVQPDQSGAEALIVANLAPSGRYRSLFAASIKPHTFLALHLFYHTHPEWFVDCLPAKVYIDEKDPIKLAALPHWKTVNYRITQTAVPYYIGKRTAHARSYKMGWKTFQNSVLKDSEGALALTAAQCKTFLAMFDYLFPEIATWQNEVIFTYRADRELFNLFGYPRRFERTFSHGYDREAISWIPQSTVGCLSTEAILLVEDYIFTHKKAWNLLNQKHDSILYEVPFEDVDECARVSRDAIRSFELTGRDGIKFRMKSEVKVGENWANFDKETNVKGMKDYDFSKN